MGEWLMTLAAASVMATLLSAVAGDGGPGKTAKLVLGLVFLIVVLTSTAKLLGGMA